MSQAPQARRWPRCVFVPAALALGLRGIHLAFLAVRDPLFDQPVVDALFHAHQGALILKKGLTLPGSGAFYKGPLLSYVFALTEALFGYESGAVAVRVINVLLGTLVVALVARIALRLGGERAAWIAGLGAALFGTAIYYDATMLQPPWLSFFSLWAADRLLVAEERSDPFWPLFAAGLALGLLTVTRGEGLLGLFLVLVWACLRARKKVWPGLASGRAASLVLVPALLVLLPVTFRNTMLERDPVVVSWNGGINLFMGNDPAFDQGSGNWHPDLAWTRLFEAPKLLGKSRGADHQRFFLKQTWRAVTARPGQALGLLWKKATLLVTGYEISNNQRIYEARAQSPLLALLLWRAGDFCFPAALFLPLIAAGLVLAGSARLGRGAPLWLLAGAGLIVPILFFNTARYRLTGLLLLIPLSAVGWGGLSKTTPHRSLFLAAGVALLLGVLAIITVPAAPALPPSDPINLADIALSAGKRDEAIRWRRQGVAQDPADPLPRIRLADILRDNGQPAEALTHYRVVLEQAGLAADWKLAATRSTARCYLLLKNFDQAEAWYRKYLAADPDQPWTDGRPDFHITGVPPLQACAMRIELARALAGAGRIPAALVELNQVTTDCAESEKLAGQARGLLRQLTGAGNAGQDRTP